MNHKYDDLLVPHEAKILPSCFICNNKSTSFKNISENKSCVSNTPFAQCIGQIIGSKFLVVISNQDLVCQHCSNLIDQRDELLFSAQQVETALANYLKHKYEITEDVHKNSTVEDEPSCLTNLTYEPDAKPEHEESLPMKSPAKRTVIVSIKRMKKKTVPRIDEFFTRDFVPAGDNLIFQEPGEIENIKIDDNFDCCQYFLCEKCEFSTDSSKLMEKHSTLHIQEKKTNKFMADKMISTPPVSISFTCSRCKLIAHTESEYLRHCMYHKKPGQIVICSECGIDNENVTGLKAHMIQYHQCLLDCKECGEQFQSQQSLEAHVENHDKGKRLTCHQCKLCYSSLTDLAYHVEQTHHIKKCNICGKEYADFNKFRSHARYHKIKKECPCPYCDKICKTSQGLKVHLSQHTGDFKFKCEICGKGSSQFKSYREHINQHSDNPQTLYTCEKCGKEFKYYGSYYSHRVWHDNPYPFVCKYCGLKVRHRQLLTVHIRKEHTFENPYKCELCDREFVEKRQFKLHMQRHEGSKNHFCDDCGKGFLLLSHLRVHQSRIHGKQGFEKLHMTDDDYKVVIPGQPAQYMPHSDSESS